MDDQIRVVLTEHAHLPVDAMLLADDADLYQLGLKSHATINVMLAPEETFGVEFPEQMLRRSTFQSVQAIRSALSLLTTDSHSEQR